jgi:hypothetical protein
MCKCDRDDQTGLKCVEIAQFSETVIGLTCLALGNNMNLADDGELPAREQNCTRDRYR